MNILNLQSNNWGIANNSLHIIHLPDSYANNSNNFNNAEKK